MKLGRKRKRMETLVELNITAFLNLMVILVPFLLITAVFSRMTILELNLPSLDAKAAQTDSEPDKPKLQLQVWITGESLKIQALNFGHIKTISTVDQQGKSYEDIQRKVWNPLTEVLVELKSRFPEVQDVALLLSPDVEYHVMIDVMDHVRSAQIVQAGTLSDVELFPVVSIGDLPQVSKTVGELQEGES